jgi:uncharacterized protein (TIGR02271 family)
MEGSTAIVTGRDGWHGTLMTPADGRREVVILLDDGREVRVASDLLRHQRDDRYYLDIDQADLYQAESHDAEQRVVPVVEERLNVERRAVETGRVRITKSVHEREEMVDLPLVREEVHVERVPINRYVDAPVAVRHDGDTMIVPLVEEVLVVEKRLVLREEIHITKQRSEARNPQSVTLQREEAIVERLAPRNEQEGGGTILAE